MGVEWRVDGTYFEACTCKGACPCLFGGDPTEGTCDALVGWHVERGHFGETRLDGLNLAMMVHAPGNLTAGGWSVVVYVDAEADEAQRDALVQIYGGQAGGHPATLASFVGEILGIETAPMTFTVEGRRVGLRIGNHGAAALEGIEGQDGASVRITGHPVAIAPGNDLMVAQSREVSHRGHGIDLSVEQRTAYYGPFRYQAG
ncbi:DUF1326 domain-containing protein [Aquisalimonas lutea]|uniref:DUF1326 domain-containing protein n=1 Tax=Aquisalimonas lutea TaxID=1327750 RepID=UPI0025B2842C|nr:DUF1326 domain-containing protein [Aquisalimonas lutea]MDN3517597.1 DUF1326 domain-containing protein [Aquisalimonas lutea]